MKIVPYFRLMRWDRPIGFFLLLWPTLWALWLAGNGQPSLGLFSIFCAGVVIMRSAGCVINDIADRKIDGYVERTKTRPLVQGDVTLKQALGLFLFLCLSAFALTLLLNTFTRWLAVGGVLLAAGYPFVKRYSHWPQAWLGIVFGGWPILMAYAAVQNTIPKVAYLLFIAASLWPLMYDTMYAMVDREDDLKIGVKSTAIFLGSYDRAFVFSLQMVILGLLILVGYMLRLQAYYYVGLTAGLACFIYQAYLIKDAEKASCFKAFLHNNWFGLCIFFGVAVSIR